MTTISHEEEGILIEIAMNDNYKIKVGTKLSQNEADAHTRPFSNETRIRLLHF
jgi:uncharacterized membrane protein YgcG